MAVEVFFFNVLQQTTRGGNHDVLVSLKTSMWFMCHAGNGRDIQMRIFRQLTGVFSNLHRQFARWRQD
jgi:hypothetical protein